MIARGRSEAECFLARECSHCGKTFLHALGRPYQMVVNTDEEEVEDALLHK